MLHFSGSLSLSLSGFRNSCGGTTDPESALAESALPESALPASALPASALPESALPHRR
jgi:hypothetical protein